MINEENWNEMFQMNVRGGSIWTWSLSESRFSKKNVLFLNLVLDELQILGPKFLQFLEIAVFSAEPFHQVRRQEIVTVSYTRRIWLRMEQFIVKSNWLRHSGYGRIHPYVFLEKEHFLLGQSNRFIFKSLLLNRLVNLICNCH